MVDGTIIKTYGGFYFVDTGKSQWRCTLKGVFRHLKVDVMVGDRVAVRRGVRSGGVVEKVYPRRNSLIRPPVANVDRIVAVLAVKNPDPSLSFLDRLLISAGHLDIEPVICVNKTDLAAAGSPDLTGCYAAAGYRVVKTSATGGDGLESLRAILSEGLSVFTGASGVGKSSLLNAVQPGLSLKTGEIGQKIKRGKHTTRHVELLPLEGGGMVADTPGFSTIFLPEMEKEELCRYYPEMEKYLAGCRFRGCLHSSEPDCAVKEAVSKKEIDVGRYRRYIEILEEITERERMH